MKSDCKELLVVAIDFGTTFSGYAFSFKYEFETDPTRISCNTKWTSCTHSYGSLKTPTTLLLKFNDTMKKPEYHGFGYEAQDRYTTLVEDDEHDDYILLDCFKMKLYSDSAVSKLHKDTVIDIGKGLKLKAIEVVSIFIEFLKNHFWMTMTTSSILPGRSWEPGIGTWVSELNADTWYKWLYTIYSKSDIKKEEIRWVLTVPAIWTDGAKQFMREAAVMAGLSNSKLTIVYEPEAAALWCLYIQDPSTKEKKTVLEIGTKCIVIDAGGGTVDYTVHEVTDTKQLVVKFEASGGPWGGTSVDDKFLGLFREIFGEEVYTIFVQNHREDFVSLKREFEIKKRHIRDDQKDIRIKFPASIGEIYNEINKKSIRFATFGKYSNKIKLVNDKIKIDTDVIMELFRETVDHIVNHTRTLLRRKEAKGTTTLLLVGGFMGSDILQQEIKKNFPKLKRIVPKDPELAVLNGAVLFGHIPMVVKTRVARYTYGLMTATPFNKTIHPTNKRETIDGIDYCVTLFEVHVKKGQTLYVGEPEPKKKYTPSSAKQTVLEFEFYASTEENPRFVTDDGCFYIGKLCIEMPDTTGGRYRVAFAQLSFGDTEITAVATEEKTGKSVSASFNFIG